MVAPSLAVLWLGFSLFVLALSAFLWAFLTGQLEHLEEQAKIALEPEDLLLLRPWETPEQRQERQRLYGPLLAPRPGEWGGTW